VFLVDKSGSMEGAIAQSVEALTRILAGIPAERLHIATFDTTGRVLRPKASTRVAVQHMLSGVKAGGGTVHASALSALHRDGLRLDADAKVIVIVVGDENGEHGEQFARAFRDLGIVPAAFALILSVAHGWPRGSTVRGAATALQVPFSEVTIDQFDDPYQVTRVLTTILSAPVLPGTTGSGWLDRVLATPLLEKPL
jgi:von Willebrand factor type A domain